MSLRAKLHSAGYPLALCRDVVIDEAIAKKIEAWLKSMPSEKRILYIDMDYNRVTEDILIGCGALCIEKGFQVIYCLDSPNEIQQGKIYIIPDYIPAFIKKLVLAGVYMILRGNPEEFRDFAEALIE